MRNGPILWAVIFILGTGVFVLLLNSLYPGTLANEDNQMRLVYSIGLLALVGSSLVAGFRAEHLSNMVRNALIWVAIFLVVLLAYGYRDFFSDAYSRVTGDLNPSSPTTLESGVVSLRTADGGHFLAWGEVDGVPVHFLVDTGATEIALSLDDARRVGIDVDNLTFNVPYSTANGTAFGARLTLDHVAIGDISLYDVRAHVSQGGLDQSLLGMSFLNRLSGFERTRDQLILRQ